jgi:parvulin-like peptidyl-prolyl isomerase
MLEGMRRQGASIFIYLIFGILIAMFVVNFGPQSPGSGQGCSGGGDADTAITINGNKIRGATAFRSVYSFFKARGAREEQAKTSAMEFLLRREMLAAEAEARGLVSTEAMATDEIKRGYMFVGGQRVDMHEQFFEKIDDKYIFDLKRRFDPFVASLNVSRSVFIEQQQRELLAAIMAESLRGSVVVSRDEALAEFLHERNTATYDVVSFSPRAYRSAFQISDDDIQRYLAAHAAEVEAKFKTDERLYKGVKPQIHVRQIFIAKATAKPDAAKPDAAKPDAAKPDATKPDATKPASAATAEVAAVGADAGKAKLELARADIAAGKRTFVEAARQLSSEASDRANGGDLGWRTKEAPAFVEGALNDAVKALKVGETSPVISTDRGTYLITVQDQREGDLSFEQVKTEIALELAKDGWSKEAARRSAIAALDGVRKGEIKDLNKLYKPTAPPAMDLQRIINDPSLSPEIKQQLLQQYLQQQGNEGALSIESENVPAAWAEDAAAPAAAGAAPAAPTAAGTAPAAPTAAGAAPTAPAAVAAIDLMKPSSDVLPAMSPVAPPNVSRAGPTPRNTRLPELGASKLAAQAVFESLAAGEVAPDIYEVDGDYVVVQLIERQAPKMEDFDKDADQRMRGLRDARGQNLVEGWLKERCQQLNKAKKIKANPVLTRNTDDNGKPGPSFYQPCMSFR